MQTFSNAPVAPLASINVCLVRRCERAYNTAIRAEEAAETEAKAWRLAKASERALRRLQAAQAGLPLPVASVPRTARNLARGGFAVLAMIGRAVARALATQAALRKAQAAGIARRAAVAAARLIRQAMRRTVGTVARLVLRAVPVVTVTKKEIIVMKVPTLAARIHAGQGHNYSEVSVDNWGLLRFTDAAGRFAIRTELRADRFVFSGGIGEHSIAADALITDATRLIAHWQGYVDNTVKAYAAADHRQALRRAGHMIALRALALVGGAS